LFSPRDPFVAGLVGLTLTVLLIDIIRLKFPRINERFMTAFRVLLRAKEVSTLTGSTYFLIAASIIFIFCDKAIAAIALAFAAVGDPIAGIVGERWGTMKMSSEEQKTCRTPKFCRNLRFRWMRGKSWQGNLACFVACLIVGGVLATVTQVALWIVVMGAMCAATVEFVSLPINDNLTIPLVSAGVMNLVHSVTV